MSGLETNQDAISPTRNNHDALAYSSPTDSVVDLEKAETLPPTATLGIGTVNTRTRSNLSRLRSAVTDGYSFYNFEDEDDQQAEQENSTTDPADLQKTRTQRDPFEVCWDGPDDKDFPRNFHVAKKWVSVLITCVGSFCVTYTSSVYTTSYGQLMRDFHCSHEVATLGLSLFVLGLAFGPMLLGPLSEFYGRRPIYIGSLFFFLIWLIPCAAAQNIQTMIIGRFFNGFAGSAFLAVAAGTVTDVFEAEDIEFPMMIFSASPFLGPAAGPVVGGFINQFASWRWTFYSLLIWTFLLLHAVILFVPETHHKVLLKHRAHLKRKSTGDTRYFAPLEKRTTTIFQTILRSCKIPIQLLVLEPMCLMLDLYAAILLGIVYLFFGAFPLVFEKNHDFQLYQVGLTFLGLGIGIVIGVASDPLWHKLYLHLRDRRQASPTAAPLKPQPELRLPPAMFGGILVPIGLFMFGWTTYRSVHWIVPIIGSGVFGCGLFLAFTGILTFLVDAYSKYAASAVAANVLVRLLFAAAFPLFGTQMYENLGYQWASSLLGFLALACVPMPFFFYRYGERIRARSRFNSKTTA